VTSGLEGAWTAAPVRWTHQYLSFLFDYEWETTQSPAGATQWRPTDRQADGLVPDAHDSDVRHAPMMMTTDLSMRQDSDYEAISRRFRDNPEEFEAAFGKAWFKLTHRDMGPRTRYLGADVPEEVFIWQDPVPAVDHALITGDDAQALKGQILASGLTTPELIRTAWASASTFRRSDMRGGANGARVRLAPQNEWSVNAPTELGRTVAALEAIQTAFNASSSGGRQVSLADVIVLGGVAAVEDAASKGGLSVEMAFTPGRTDATQDQTEVASFAPLEPKADGFRNFYTEDALRRPSDALIDKADLLDLTVHEMTALLGGMRVLGGNAGGSAHGVFTESPGILGNDFFTTLTDLSTTWRPAAAPYTFEGVGIDGAVQWTATEADLVFGSNAELRAVSEVYAYDEAKFAQDFADAWTKVMQADRFDMHR
jgi:catalase-peroxidase